MADGSTKVVYAALAGNVLVAVTKFGAAALSGSSAMLTEAVHSTADCTNQILLLIGNRRSRAPADSTHEFGYGGEVYFWAVVVAGLVLLVGGVASIVEGIVELRHPTPVRSPAISLGVLALSVVFEGGSLLISRRESKRVVASHPIPGQAVSLWQFIKRSKDPNLYEALLEDAAALIGIAIAAAGIILNVELDLLWADGVASLCIGLLLVAVAWVIQDATRRLVGGEPVASALRRDLIRALDASATIAGHTDLRTLHLGPRVVLVTLTVKWRDGRSSEGLSLDLDQLTAELRAVDERIVHVFFRLRS